MPPCSPVLNSGCRCENTEFVNNNKSMTKEMQVSLGNLICLNRPCQIFSPSRCQGKQTDNPFAKCTEIDPTNMIVLTQKFCYCGHSGQCCNIVTRNMQCMHLLPFDKSFCLNLKPCVLKRSEQKKKSLQYLVRGFFNNPQNIHEHHEIDEVHQPQNVEHHEPQHDDPQHDEHCQPQNDSGFDSGGWECNVLDSRNDLRKLIKNSQELEQCCFYYGTFDSQTSSSLLRKKPIGTFLVRDSSDPRYLYSLSVKTEKGATSIRILYDNGFFQFDSNERIRHKLPRFETVLALIDFHVKATEEGRNKLWRWEELSGCKSLNVVLSVPLRNSVPSLTHLSRVKINQCMNNIECPCLSVYRLPLDSDYFKGLLWKYPYQI